MITPEKMFEMMNPSKAFEMMDPSKAFALMSQGKVFDVKAQSKLLNSATDQFFGLLGDYQAQTRKVVELWLDQSETALEEGQKIVKEWSATFMKASADIVSEVESRVKDTAKVFELPPSAKAAKTA